MLRIDQVQTIEGVTVYGDDRLDHLFYLMPEQPRFRIDDETGEPVFKFLKYRFPVDREDGSKGGGFCFFDVEFTVPEEKRPAIKEKLQAQVDDRYRRADREPPEVRIGSVTYTEGSAGLLLKEDGGTLIERVSNPAKPSLFGKNVTPFALELSPEGATLFWEALQGKGGVVQVVYDLHFMAALPPVDIEARFESQAFYSFHQTVDIDWRMWKEDSYRETVRERFRNSDSMDVDIDFGGLTDEKLKKELRDWAFRTVEDAAEKRMLDQIEAVSEEGREVPDGIENLERNISNTQVSSFTLNFREKQPVEWNLAPQGTLPNITTLEGEDGEPLDPEDYFTEVDLEDPFFDQLDVAVRVNADFDELPIHSVEALVEYDAGDETKSDEFIFTSPDNVEHFSVYVEDDERSYAYSYQVNYQGEQEVFESERVETTGNEVVINVGDLGILSVDIVPGDLDFDQVRQAQVTLRYEGEGMEPLEQQFTLDDDNPTHRFQHVIFEPADRPYRYRTKYFMDDGKEFEVDWEESRLPQLAINDPFSSTRTVSVRTAGDLENEIQTIFLDLEYEDAANEYSQTRSVALSKENPFVDWAFPVLDDRSGVVRYSGKITFRDGTVKDIPKTETTDSTIMVGKMVSDFLEVEVIPQLLDFDEVRLAQVMLRYEDSERSLSDREDLVFSPDDAEPKTWTVELQEGAPQSYEWQAVYFLSDGSKKETSWSETDAPSLILENPGS